MLLRRYIKRQIYSRTFAALAVLALLATVIELSTTGPYWAAQLGWSAVTRGIALHLPLYTTLLLPLALLIGGTIAILELQRRGEWEALFATGAPILPCVGRAVLDAGLVMLALNAITAELLVPPCERAARAQFAYRTTSSLSGRANPGRWYATRGGWFIYRHLPERNGHVAVPNRFSAWKLTHEHRLIARAEGIWPVQPDTPPSKSMWRFDPHDAVTRELPSLRSALLQLDRVRSASEDTAAAEELSLRQLVERIHRANQLGREVLPDVIMLHSRLSYPLYALPIAVVLCALVARIRKRGPNGVLAYTVGWTLMLWISLTMGWQAAQLELISPALGAWAPLAMCIATSAMFLRRQLYIKPVDKRALKIRSR